MPISLESLPAPPILRVTFSGEVSRLEISDYVRSWRQKERLPDPCIAYADLSNVESFDSDSDLMIEHAQSMSAHYERWQDLLTEIILAESDLTFGFARVYQTFAGDHYPVHLFRDKNEAQLCLQRSLRTFFPESTLLGDAESA